MFPPEAYYVVQDISDRSRQLTVIVETDKRVDAEGYIRDKKLSGICDVYKEQGEELYRVICERKTFEVTTGI